MVYTAALLFAHGVPVKSEDVSVVEMIGRYFLQLTVPGTGTGSSSARRGSVDSCDDMENNAPCKFTLKSPTYFYYS